MKRIFRAAVLAALAAGGALAQVSHVAWEQPAATAGAPGGKALLRISGKIDPGWHLYSGSTPAGTGKPITFQVEPATVVESVRLFQTAPKRAYDPNFQSDTETFEGNVAFILELALKKDALAGPQQLTVKAQYQTCTDKECVASRWQSNATLQVEANAATVTIPAGFSEAKPAPRTSGVSTGADQGLLGFLLVAFGFGLASIFTPCVFPMIPITMSYFLNRPAGGRGDSIAQAVVFCLGIVVLFSGLGLAATAILGPFGVTQLASNPWVGGFIAALFIAFGLSLLGAFEITIPSFILTRLNKSSEGGGFGGTLLMGLTFSLASFACVGPFVGTLLAASVQGGGIRPLVGMATFAAGLALPFFFLALFPAYLKRLPRSGGWMSRVKVVMGFVILAASLKYLSGVDQVLRWNLITRERFLAAWIVLFSMAGLYLLGFLRLEGVKPDDKLGMGRLLTGMALLVFAISLIPGMFDKPLGDLDAYVPASTAPASGQASGETLTFMKDQYREALAKARAENKLVFVNFTGYNCANCHWMRRNILSQPEIASILNGFVLVELYTDGFDATSDENQKLEMAKFQTVAAPYYAIMDADENVTATFAYTRDAAEFRAFLEKGRAAKPAAATPATQASGSTIPEVKALDGSTISAAALSGKVAVVNFWATWCVPCLKEIPHFNKVSKEFASQGVRVVGVSVDEEGAVVQPFLKKHPMEYPVGVGPQSFMETYALEPLPVTLIFDRNGKLLQRLSGGLTEDELRAAVQKAVSAS